MADTAVAITAGSGTNVDTRTEATNGNHRQVVVIGDPSLNAGVAAVKDASTAPVATDPALVVAISPNSVNANGATASAGSAPVVLATDQAWPVGTTGFMKKEDVASADGDAGIPAMAIRQASPADSSGSDGDYEMIRIKDGRIYGRVTLDPGATATVTQAASSTITRPTDTTAYASGDLVANSVTAGSVNNLQFATIARVSGGSGVIVGAQIQKSTAGVTNAAFRLHLFNAAPTYTSAGDNSALGTVVVASSKGYLGYIDITAMIAFSDVAWGSGAPDNSRGSIPYVATAQIIYGLLEARGAYTPGNAEVFTVVLDALQD